MPYKDPEKARACRRACYAANKERWAAVAKAWRDANKKGTAARGRAWYAVNKARHNANAKARRAANKESYAATNKASRWKSRYDIPTWLTPYLAEHMATGNCPGCGVKFGHPGSTFGAVIDHDQDTGLVRMIVCTQCNTTRLCRSNDGRNPDALLVSAGHNAKETGRVRRARAIIQVRLAALLISHYRGGEHAAAVAKALSIPLPD